MKCKRCFNIIKVGGRGRFYKDGKGDLQKIQECSEKSVNFALKWSKVGVGGGGGGGVCLGVDRQAAACLFPGSQYTGNGTPTDMYTHVSHPPNPQ